MRHGKGLKEAFFLVAMLVAAAAQAYQFVPTDVEWQSWPGYCKARYVGTNIGQTSRFINKVSPADRAALASWQRSGIRGVHHYCAGTIYLYRAMLEENDQRRRSMLANAAGETEFSFSRSRKSSPFFAHLAQQMATILHEQGESEVALEILQDAVNAQPKSGMLYSAMAIIQRKLGRLEDARVTLESGRRALDHPSAELSYNLGLISLELGDIDNAVEHARTAYELGFPLPGLRNKLEKLGRM